MGDGQAPPAQVALQKRRQLGGQVVSVGIAGHGLEGRVLEQVGPKARPGMVAAMVDPVGRGQVPGVDGLEPGARAAQVGIGKDGQAHHGSSPEGWGAFAAGADLPFLRFHHFRSGPLNHHSA